MFAEARRRGCPGAGRFVALALLALTSISLLPTAMGHALSPDCVAHPGTSPDVIVGDIYEQSRWGTVGGITAFSVGTKSCNTGTCQLNWISSTNDHPVIGQNMFRLKDGRFEQVGQSWLKHGFTALQQTLCGTCQASSSGAYLGVNCSDPYSASLNGSQTRLGPKFEVNPVTGDYPYPPTNGSTTGDAIFKRLQVHNTDLDPTLNTGAQYWVEAVYVSWDDASTGNLKNNYSYRPITVSGTSPTFTIALTGSTARGLAAIEAWKAVDPTITLTSIGVAGDGAIEVGAKVTQLGPSLWHYEYGVMNINSWRAVGSFSVPIPSGATITNIGFHDVDYHSGEPIVGTDWTPTVMADQVLWTTETYAANPNANSLRWGTLYNFRFDANIAPGTGTVTMGLWRPGTPVHGLDHHGHSGHVQLERHLQPRRRLQQLPERLLPPGRRDRLLRQRHLRGGREPLPLPRRLRSADRSGERLRQQHR